MYDLFSGFSDFFDNFEVFPTYREVKSCPGCGRTYQSFQKTGKFGCPKCYETFRNPITVTLRQIHQNSKHTGKIPDSCAFELKKKRQYEELKAELQKAVREENYEKAAGLHKQLKAMGNVEG